MTSAPTLDRGDTGLRAVAVLLVAEELRLAGPWYPRRIRDLETRRALPAA